MHEAQILLMSELYTDQLFSHRITGKYVLNKVSIQCHMYIEVCKVNRGENAFG